MGRGTFRLVARRKERNGVTQLLWLLRPIRRRQHGPMDATHWPFFPIITAPGYRS